MGTGGGHTCRAQSPQANSLQRNPLRAHQRPQTAKSADDRMKLHRHAVAVGDRTYTVITLRPGTYARFSNNYYHHTWHILSDLHGARVLGRLLWGLSYQRVPGTLVLIDRPNIDPSPFSAAPADPIALVPSHITSLPERAARVLRARLPLTRPEGTVRWHTPGLDYAVAALAAGHARWQPRRDRAGQGRIARTGGLVNFTAPPQALREWAVEVYRLGSWITCGMDYTYLSVGEKSRYEGEVQVFTDYRHRVRAARAARREILHALRPLPPDDVDPDIWARADAIRRNTRPVPDRNAQRG
jgi:hypothetical protein